MSYCHLVAGVGINLVNGFGALPGNFIRNKANYCIYTSKLAVTVVSTSANTTAACNGFQIVVTATGGTGAKTFSVAPNVDSQAVSGTFTGLSPNTYVFTTTDANGCTATENVTITEGFAFTAVSKANAGVSDGRILISGISGSKPYTFAISPNTGTQPYAGAFTGLAAGTYAVTVTDANGCTASTNNIVVGTFPSLTVNTNSVSFCNGSSVNLNSLITTSGGSSVVWSKKPQAVQGASGSLYHFVLLSNGTLTGWGENSSGQLTFPTFAAPIKQISANLRHSTALLTNGSVVGWGHNSNGQNNIPTFAAPPIKISTGGNYNLALLLDGSLIGWGYNLSGEVNIPDFTVTVNPKPVAPVVTASGPTTFCSGGSVTLNTNVSNNNALNFVKTSSQYVFVPHSTSINLGATFTMEAWVNYSGSNSTIVDKGNYNFLWSLNANSNGNKMGFYTRNTGAWVYSTGAIPKNTWTHVAVTLNAGTLTFYINGVASGTATVAFSQDVEPMNIGRQQPTACVCNHFNGSMDELRLWNVVRTPAELQVNKNNALPVNAFGQPVSPGLVA